VLGITESKRIADPIHGAIALTKLELSIASCTAFQRLRNIKQLGLGFLVYPASDYSRFEHSIGVCHVTGLILSALKDIDKKISDEEIQLYRLAGLFHDIGHYPFSHAIEFGLEEYYSSLLLEKKGNGININNSKPVNIDRYFSHERVGKEILEKDPNITRILKEHGIYPREVYSIFLREKPPRFSNLISSDLDADRIDYLLRTAHHAGLPYGSIDVNYLLSQIRLDGNNNICLTSKALRTAEHLLLSRYFDYQQISFHKTVAGLEEVLKDLVSILLKKGYLEITAKIVTELIESGEWQFFDDQRIINLIRDLYVTETDEHVKNKAACVLYRHPPKLIVEYETLGRIEEETKSNFTSGLKLLYSLIPKIEEKFDISQDCIYIWKKSGTKLTKIGSYLPVTDIHGDNKDLDNLEQAIRILNRDGTTSTPIMSLNYSLMHILSQYALYSYRLYVLLTPKQIGLREEITDFVKTEMSHIHWK